MSECVCVCVNQAQRTQVWLCACVGGSLCASCGCVWACAWSQVDECVPVGACSDLDIRPQLVHHRARHEGEKGGTYHAPGSLNGTAATVAKTGSDGSNSSCSSSYRAANAQRRRLYGDAYLTKFRD